ncbi:MAG: isopentenyl phosphate kinase [Halodesulfurarchaeum sp.]
MTEPPVVLKLGGSVITEKERPETVAEEGLRRAAAAVGEHAGPLVLVHGGGSFGHPAAEAAGVSPESGTHDASAIREIHAAMGRLNEAVLDALDGAAVSAVPVRPLSTSVRRESGDLDVPTATLRAMLAEGFVPVLHGDIVTSRGRGATILSGDELVVALARELDVDRIGLCTTVPGVLDEEQRVISRIANFESVADVLEGSEATDVTGGMAGKVRALLSLETDAHVFDLDGLESFLDGGAPGTTIGDG